MRISDWSSDVCSSDLFMCHEFKGGVPGQVAGGEGFAIPLGGKALLLDERDEIGQQRGQQSAADGDARGYAVSHDPAPQDDGWGEARADRKSTRLNSSH